MKKKILPNGKINTPVLWPNEEDSFAIQIGIDYIVTVYVHNTYFKKRDLIVALESALHHVKQMDESKFKKPRISKKRREIIKQVIQDHKVLTIKTHTPVD